MPERAPVRIAFTNIPRRLWAGGHNYQRNLFEALNRHAKFIRGRVSGALRQMKYMPEFRFRLDTSFDNFARINDLLKSPEVARDLDADDDKTKDDRAKDDKDSE